MRLTAVDEAAAAAGLHIGLTLADARALVPELVSAEADTAADTAALRRLADWCGRYSPWVAVDGDDGIVIDIIGAAHLFGGEAALADDLRRRLAAFGIAGRLAVADTPAAAWAWARHGKGVVVAPGGTRAALAPLPVAALRLEAATVVALDRVGLRRIGDLLALLRDGAAPVRGTLVRRFGTALLERLDAALGAVPEPIAPLVPVPPWRARLAFAEPVGSRADIDEACRRLLERLCALLARERRGARRLELACYRVDGTVARVGIGTSQPTRLPAHLMRLLAERLETIDPGFGIDVMILAAPAADPLGPRQLALGRSERRNEEAAGALIDRLVARLGPAQVLRLVPQASHIPERALLLVPALTAPAAAGDWPAAGARPVSLLPCPEPVEVVAPGAAEGEGNPPLAFRWRRVVHRVARAEGPERIAPEWWRDPAAAARDYYRVEDEDGRRFWLYRDDRGCDEPGGAAPRWYLHGLLA